MPSYFLFRYFHSIYSLSLSLHSNKNSWPRLFYFVTTTFFISWPRIKKKSLPCPTAATVLYGMSGDYYLFLKLIKTITIRFQIVHSQIPFNFVYVQ